MLCLSVWIVSGVSKTLGQSVTSPERIALGGGNAFITGTSSHFYNPANLMIRSDRRSTHISLGMGGLYQSDGLSINHIDQIGKSAEPYFLPGNLKEQQPVTDAEIHRMFGDDEHYYQTHHYDAVPLAITWRKNGGARSIAIRSRGYSSFEMNRNWFNASPSADESDEIYSRYLNEKYLVLHELSFGLAREVTMFNNWQAGLNTLLVGLAPKIMIGGMHNDTRYQSDYTPENGVWHNSRQLHTRISGDYESFVSELILAGDAGRAFNNHLNPNSNFDMNGVGLGLDAGLTYIIPLSDDISLSPHNENPLRKSLRFSISVTDLGMVRFNKNSSEWKSASSTTTIDELQASETRHSGTPGTFFDYIQTDDTESVIFHELEDSGAKSYTEQLPTELHIGSALQYQWITTMLDLNYRFNASDFNPEGWRASVGTEVRPIRFFPIRASIHINPDRDLDIGLGAGMDIGFLYLSGGMRIFAVNHDQTDWYARAISTLGLQIRF